MDIRGQVKEIFSKIVRLSQLTNYDIESDSESEEDEDFLYQSLRHTPRNSGVSKEK